MTTYFLQLKTELSFDFSTLYIYAGLEEEIESIFELLSYLVAEDVVDTLQSPSKVLQTPFPFSSSSTSTDTCQ